jgi:hypothetical protein
MERERTEASDSVKDSDKFRFLVEILLSTLSFLWGTLHTHKSHLHIPEGLNCHHHRWQNLVSGHKQCYKLFVKYTFCSFDNIRLKIVFCYFTLPQITPYYIFTEHAFIQTLLRPYLQLTFYIMLQYSLIRKDIYFIVMQMIQDGFRSLWKSTFPAVGSDLAILHDHITLWHRTDIINIFCKRPMYTCSK